MHTDPGVALRALATEGRNPASAQLDALDALGIARLINAEDASVARAVQTELPQVGRAIEGIAARLRRGGRLVYVGAGTSGRLGVLDASECPPTFGTPPGMVAGLIAGGPEALTRSIEAAEDDPEAGREDARRLGVGEADAVVGIAASGRTPYVLGAVGYAREEGALTIGLACNPDTALAAACEIAISPITGPEVIAGSTRLKAGTAQKMVLNMLSSGAMVLLGKTYGNLMVDVQPTNEKLRRRSVAIVEQATGLGRAECERRLLECGGEVKTAIVGALAGIPPDEARARLGASGGVVRAALEGGR